MQQSFGVDSVSIIQGSSRDLKILLRSPDGEAFDLEGVTAVKAFFPGKPTPVQVTLAASEVEILEPKSRGALVVSLSSVKTKLLTVDQRMTFELELTQGDQTHVVQFKEMLDVERRLS